MLSPLPSFLNTAQSSGSGEQSERCGTYPYSKSPDGADLNQPPRPPAINTAENQQTRGIISSGICCGQPLWAGGTLPASVLRISPLNSSMKALRLARATTRASGGGRARWPRGPVWALVLLWRNKLSPSENIMLRDKTLHLPLWSSNQSVSRETRHL